MKTCIACKKEKDLEEFSVVASLTKMKCKDCDAIFQKENPHIGWSDAYRKEALSLKMQLKLHIFTKPQLIEEWGDKCFRCEGGWDQLYYLIPIAEGGAHSVDNCRPVCQPCSLIEESEPEPEPEKVSTKETKPTPEFKVVKPKVIKEKKIKETKPQVKTTRVLERTCIFEGCTRPFQAKGYCKTHYNQLLKWGEVRPIGQNKFPEFCTYVGCDRPHASMGYCRAHYTQLRNKGEVSTLNPNFNPETPLMDRLMARVLEDGDCLLWQGATNGAKGAGQIRYRGKTYLTKHAMFLAVNGYESPTPLVNTCGNKTCVNIAHIAEY